MLPSTGKKKLSKITFKMILLSVNMIASSNEYQNGFEHESVGECEGEYDSKFEC